MVTKSTMASGERQYASRFSGVPPIHARQSKQAIAAATNQQCAGGVHTGDEQPQ